MSVRQTILAVLTLGPAYGLQLHDEVELRTCREGTLNVGQVYSTLGRLKTAGLVACDTVTAGGLPLYELTPEGRQEAHSWLGTAQPVSGSAWGDMMDHVLLAVSLPGQDPLPLIRAYEEAWRGISSQKRIQDVGSAAVPGRRLARAQAEAERLLAHSALAWLEQIRIDPSEFTIAMQSERPRRGRRPVRLLQQTEKIQSRGASDRGGAQLGTSAVRST
ncbi:PadR family transcriptional regulator [Subtercola frigoramans]|uniref:DNA-binding PadR family transcriptional regulator n=1 Tax=Subtercola frigoramans TaxID=120298 RepID=A0ABS2L6D0_9MICO|nr:PadR family transcriptional regulator [Subtercola frigoramans]MBM7472051.1 DNA-binding PadR family transcriptional regulator [Subtercola frigoramans]